MGGKHGLQRKRQGGRSGGRGEREGEEGREEKRKTQIDEVRPKRGWGGKEEGERKGVERKGNLED